MIWQIDACFSRRTTLNSPVGRLLCVSHHQAIPGAHRHRSHLALDWARWLRGSSTSSLKSRCMKEETKPTATGSLTLQKPQLWPNVGMLQAAGPIIQIICLIKAKWHREGTLNSSTAYTEAVCPHCCLQNLITFIPLATIYHLRVREERKNAISSIILQDFPFYNSH